MIGVFSLISYSYELAEFDTPWTDCIFQLGFWEIYIMCTGLVVPPRPWWGQQNHDGTHFLA